MPFKLRTALLAAIACMLGASPFAAAAEFAPPASLPGDVVIGSPDAPVTVYEYASLSCPHCARFHADVLPEFRRTWIDTGKARIVFRHFPLDTSALAAALAVSCLPANDREAAVARLYATVADWSSREDLARAMIDTVRPRSEAADFVSCMSSKETADAVAEAAIEAGKGGVSATPTFIVNGTSLVGVPKPDVLGGLVDIAVKDALAR